MQWWGAPMHGFSIFPLDFMIAMIVLVAFLVRRMWDGRGPQGRGWGPGGWGPGRGPRSDGGGTETPRQILDRRYASGELTKDQYDQMRRDIEPVSG